MGVEKRWKRAVSLAICLAMTVGMTGCGGKEEDAGTEAAEEVSVAVAAGTPQVGVLSVSSTFIGTVSPQEQVSIIPLVSGEVTEVNFEVGDHVEAGSVLVRIDDEAARLQLESAQLTREGAELSAQRTLGSAQVMSNLSMESNINSIQYQIDMAKRQYDAAGDSVADAYEAKGDMEDALDKINNSISEMENGYDDMKRMAASAKSLVRQNKLTGIWEWAYPVEPDWEAEYDTTPPSGRPDGGTATTSGTEDTVNGSATTAPEDATEGNDSSRQDGSGEGDVSSQPGGDGSGTGSSQGADGGKEKDPSPPPSETEEQGPSAPSDALQTQPGSTGAGFGQIGETAGDGDAADQDGQEDAAPSDGQPASSGRTDQEENGQAGEAETQEEKDGADVSSFSGRRSREWPAGTEGVAVRIRRQGPVGDRRQTAEGDGTLRLSSGGEGEGMPLSMEDIRCHKKPWKEETAQNLGMDALVGYGLLDVTGQVPGTGGTPPQKKSYEEYIRDKAAYDAAYKAISEAVSRLKAAGYSPADIGEGRMDSSVADYAAQIASLRSQASTLESNVKSMDSNISSAETSRATTADSIDFYEQNLENAQIQYGIQNGQAYQDTAAALANQIASTDVGIASARLQLENYVLTAPISGQIEQKNVDEYGMVSAGNPVYVISNKDTMTVTFYVSEAVKSQMAVGETVTLERNGRTWTAAVTQIGQSVDARTGLFEIKAMVEGDELANGVTVKIIAHTAKTADALLIPYDAVYYQDEQAYVYCVEDDVLVKTPVETGLYDEETVEITGGLTRDSVVVHTWSSQLADGTKVHLVEED